MRYIIWCYSLESCKIHTDGKRTSNTTFRSEWGSSFIGKVGAHLQSTRPFNSPKWEPQPLHFYFEVSSSRWSSSILLPRLNLRAWNWVHSPNVVGNKSNVCSLKLSQVLSLIMSWNYTAQRTFCIECHWPNQSDFSAPTNRKRTCNELLLKYLEISLLELGVILRAYIQVWEEIWKCMECK